MWLGDLLYGRPEERAYRIDVDDVRDIVKILEDAYPGIAVTLDVVGPAGSRPVELTELQDISAAELQRLQLDAQLPGFESIAWDPSIRWMISLRRDVAEFNVPNARPANEPADSDLADADEVARKIRQVFRDASLPMLRRRRLVRWRAAAVAFPFIIAIAAWVSLEITMRLPVAAHVLGWALLVSLALATERLYRDELVRLPLPADPKNGHLVLGQTRRETKANRAGSRRDLKVAGWSILGTIATAGFLYFTLGIGR